LRKAEREKLSTAAVEVGIGEHNAGVLAAQLERHITHAFGSGFHDGRAGARLAGEGDGIDARCRVTNSPAESGPKPCTTLYTPLGMPTVFITSPSKVAVLG
jgi:hypothetical protein